MSEFNKYSTDGGATFIDVEDSNAVHWSDNNILGAKNFIPYPYSNTSRTAGGITLTANADGTVSSNNATATADCFFDCQTGIVNKFPNGTYKLTGCPENQNNKMEIQIRFRLIAGQNSSNDLIYRDYGNGITFTLTNTQNYPEVYISCAVRNGYNPTNKVFYPMLRLASDTNNTYAPYAKTNRELTRENKYYPGDIITLHGLSGYISSGATELFYQINGKFDESVKAIQISGTDVRVRGTKGYIKDNNAVELAGVNFATYLKLNSFSKFSNQINVSIKTLSGNAFTNVDNNTPISISGTFTITLS